MDNKTLSITDLAVIRNAIDLACTRGAYRATEMRTIGEVYEKLEAFLNMVVAQAESESKQTPQPGEQE